MLQVSHNYPRKHHVSYLDSFKFVQFELLRKLLEDMFVRSGITEDTQEVCQGSPSTSNSYFPASKLFEYSWPLSDPDAEFYMLQEQVSEYLELRGGAFQRKYPGNLIIKIVVIPRTKAIKIATPCSTGLALYAGS